MGSPIGSFRPIEPTDHQFRDTTGVDKQQTEHTQHAENAQNASQVQGYGGAGKQQTEHVQSTQQTQNAQAAAQEIERVHGHGSGGHSKVAEIQRGHKSVRSQFRHMNSPNQTIRQQRMMADLQMLERQKLMEARNKSMIASSQKLDKKDVSKREEKEKQQKKKRDGQNQQPEDRS